MTELALRFLRSAVFLTYVVTLLRLAGFLVVMLYALRVLSPAEIGFWYVLVTLGGMLMLSDLGFFSVVARRASFYAGGAAEVPAIGLPAQQSEIGIPNLPALAGLANCVRGLYFRLSLVVGVVIGVGGWLWLHWRHPEMAASTSAGLSYATFIVASVAAASGNYWPALLFGINEVRYHQALLLVGLGVNYSLALAGLATGLGLMALVLGQVCFLLLPRVLARRKFLQQMPVHTVAQPQRESPSQIWPMAWRGGLATLGSFLGVQSTTLLCAQMFGLETTGSYSLALQMALVCHAVGSSWLAVKHPIISQLRARGEVDAAIRLIRQRMLIGVVTYVSAAVCVWCFAPWLLRVAGAKTQLLPPAQLATLLLFVGLDFWIGLHSAVLQTANRLPHLRVFLWSGVATVVLAMILGSQYGLWGLLLAPMLAQLPINFWWTPRQCWRDLQSSASFDNSGQTRLTPAQDAPTNTP